MPNTAASRYIYHVISKVCLTLTVLSRNAGRMARWKPCTQIMSPSWKTSTTYVGHHQIRHETHARPGNNSKRVKYTKSTKRYCTAWLVTSRTAA